MYGVCCCGLAVWAWAARGGSQHPVLLVVLNYVFCFLFFCWCGGFLRRRCDGKVARGFCLCSVGRVSIFCPVVWVFIFTWCFGPCLCLRVRFRLCVYCCACRHKQVCQRCMYCCDTLLFKSMQLVPSSKLGCIVMYSFWFRNNRLQYVATTMTRGHRNQNTPMDQKIVQPPLTVPHQIWFWLLIVFPPALLLQYVCSICNAVSQHPTRCVDCKRE